MYLDLHCHSVSSDDARATVEAYLKWIQVLRQRGCRVDGIALTEHRKFDAHLDYSALAAQYGVLVLKGSELDTRCGHLLVYGVTAGLLRAFDFADVTLDAQAMVQEARSRGAIAIPAHPGRPGIGLAELLAKGASLEGLEAVEVLNHGSRPGENERAAELAAQRGLRGIGASDAHFASAIASCLTEFQDPIRNEAELVEALHAGRFRAVRLEETRRNGDSFGA
jgi:predicted metal-dependent phosphoesterase TrpH